MIVVAIDGREGIGDGGGIVGGGGGNCLLPLRLFPQQTQQTLDEVQGPERKQTLRTHTLRASRHCSSVALKPCQPVHYCKLVSVADAPLTKIIILRRFYINKRCINLVLSFIYS